MIFWLKFCMKMALELGKLCAKFGAPSPRRLAVASLNILRCPKMQKFVPLISWLWAVILGFLSYRTILKFCTQVNMFMKNKFSLCASKYTLSWLKKFEMFFKNENAKFWKNSKLDFEKTVYHRPMKFFMQVHVEVKSINAKFYDSGTHSLAYMAKKTFFRIFWAFLGIFWGFLSQKTFLSFDFWAEILHEDGPGAWQVVCKIWGH